MVICDWLVSFKYNGPLRQYFSISQTVSSTKGRKKCYTFDKKGQSFVLRTEIKAPRFTIADTSAGKTGMVQVHKY